LFGGRAGLRRSEAVGLRRKDIHFLSDSSGLGCDFPGLSPDHKRWPGCGRRESHADTLPNRSSFVRVDEEGCRVMGLDMFGGEWHVLKDRQPLAKAGDTAGPIAYKQAAGNSFAQASVGSA
jgi:hypothetical protein